MNRACKKTNTLFNGYNCEHHLTIENNYKQMKKMISVKSIIMGLFLLVLLSACQSNTKQFLFLLGKTYIWTPSLMVNIAKAMPD